MTRRRDDRPPRRDEAPAGRPQKRDERRERDAAPPRGEGRREHGGARREHGGGRRDKPSPDRALIWGWHSVREALRSPRREPIRLYATAGAAERLAPELAARRLEPILATAEEIARRLPPETVHQGLLLEARLLEPLALSDISADGVVLALDQVTDPHNVGAIVRTAAAFALDAIVTTERHSPDLAGVLAKTASGGLEHVPIVTVVNLARALDELGEMGFLRVGLDSEGPASLEETTLSRPVCLALGAEGKGLRRLTRERCDVLARLDMPGPIKSLNVSNACAVALTVLRAKLAAKG